MQDIKIRKLQARDIKPFIKILKKANMFSAMKGAFEGKKEKQEIKVLDIIEKIIENYDICEEDLFLFISQVSNIEPENVGDLEISALIDILKQIFQDSAFSFFTKSPSK
jgi:hypothetical protein